MDIDEPETGIVVNSAQPVKLQVKRFNSFFKENPERFPSKHPADVKLSSLKAAAAPRAEQRDQEGQSCGETRAQNQPGKVASSGQLAADNEASILLLSSDTNSLERLAFNKMAIGVVPTAVSGTYPPPTAKLDSPESTGETLPSGPATEEVEPAEQTAPPEVRERSSGSGNLISMHVKFFEDPSTPSPEVPLRKPSAVVDASPGADSDDNQQAIQSDEGAQADDQVSSIKETPPRKVVTRPAWTSSPSLSRASSTSPKVRNGRRGITRINHTIPEPFQLATDRRSSARPLASVGRASLSARMPEPPTTPPRLRAGVVRASFASPKVPPKPAPKPATSPEPFNLESVRRHEEAQERLKAEIRAREKDEEERRKFKAQPIAQPSPPSTVKVPAPTQGAVFTFACDERAEKRKEFIKRVEEKETQKLHEKQNILETTRAELEEQIKEYRKNLVFKAVPMPGFYGKIKEQQEPGSDAESPRPKSSSRRRSLEALPSSKASSPAGTSSGTSTSAVRSVARRKSTSDLDGKGQVPKGTESSKGGKAGTSSWGAKRSPASKEAGKAGANGGASPGGLASGMHAKVARAKAINAKRTPVKGTGKGAHSSGTPTKETAATGNGSASRGPKVPTPGSEPKVPVPGSDSRVPTPESEPSISATPESTS